MGERMKGSREEKREPAPPSRKKYGDNVRPILRKHETSLHGVGMKDDLCFGQRVKWILFPLEVTPPKPSG